MSDSVPISEVETYNTKVRTENEAKRKQNEIKKVAPRRCVFELVPTNLSIPVGIVDDWLKAAAIAEPMDVLVYFHQEIHREPRIEAITSKIHGSELSLRSDGLYQWRDKARVNLRWVNEGDWTLDDSHLWAGGSSYKTILSEIELPELVASLFELNIISFPTQRTKRPRK